jgi:hypothetical protein
LRLELEGTKSGISISTFVAIKIKAGSEHQTRSQEAGKKHEDYFADDSFSVSRIM